MGNFWSSCPGDGHSYQTSRSNHGSLISMNFKSRNDEADNISQNLPSETLWVFTYGELKAATKNFSDKRLLGRGIFGKFYKGLVDEKGASKNRNLKMLVAVQRLNSTSFQRYEDWQSEVKFLGDLSHPNLVKLLGYCREGKVLFLVSEYTQRGSLKNHLFGRYSGVDRLPWDVRLKIAMGGAKGLAFLHGLEKQIIYRDFRASYILIDQFYNAKISEYGLAKMSSTDYESYTTTSTGGEYGYAAPEYVATGHLSPKSDVYGFGVVLLEMITGLHVVDPKRPMGQENLVNWIKTYLCDGRNLKNIMDPWLEGKYPPKAAFRTAQLALNCSASDPQKRPAMKQVVETLALIQAIKEKPNESTRVRSTHPTTR